MARKGVNGDTARKLKAIRGFVDFNYDLRKPLHANSKRKVDRYFQAISQIQARPNKIFRSKNKKRVRSIQQFGRNEFEALPGIKVAFVESTDANPIERIRFTGNKPSIVRKFFRQDFLEFDVEALESDARAEIARVIKSAEAAHVYRIAAGKFSIEQPRTAKQLPAAIERLMNRYGLDPDKRKHDDTERAENHHWTNWLTGLIPLYVKNQAELKQFRIKEQKQKDVLKKKRKAAKERLRSAEQKESERRG